MVASLYGTVPVAGAGREWQRQAERQGWCRGTTATAGRPGQAHSPVYRTDDEQSSTFYSTAATAGRPGRAQSPVYRTDDEESSTFYSTAATAGRPGPAHSPVYSSVADPHLLLCGSGSRIQKMSIWIRMQIRILGGKD